MQIYAIRWNPFHSDVFLTCSYDWTVRLWHSADLTKPAATYNLQCPVGDVVWSPYSSTVFAACTTGGSVFVWDIKINKLESLCSQKVAKNTTLTHIRFSNENPMVVVGDDRGSIHTFKLSPNLRKGEDDKDDLEGQKKQLDHILEVLAATTESHGKTTT